MILTILVILSALLLGHVYRVFTSPLRAVPAAHPLCRHTSLWILYHTLRNTRNAAIHAAHLKKGPLVLLSPTELSTSASNHLKPIFNTLPKPDWYSVFANYGLPPMFATLSNSSHSYRKRTVAHLYSNSAVRKSKELHVAAKGLLPILCDELAEGNGESGKEIFEPLSSLALDLVSAHLFGVKNGTRFLTAPRSSRNRWQQHYYSRRQYFPLISELPRIAKFIVPRSVDNANAALEAWCWELCTKNRNAFPKLTGLEYATEVLDHLSAGQETTSLALSFLFQWVAVRPSAQEDVYTEVAEVMGEHRSWLLPDFKRLEECQRLNNLIDSILRHFPPIPGTQRRIVPEGTSLRLPGYEEIAIPPRTVIGAQAYTVAKEEGEELWAFGSGSRGCIGKWLARWELRAIVATVLGNFALEKAEGAKDAWMGEGYTTAPGSDGKVLVKFKRRRCRKDDGAMVARTEMGTVALGGTEDVVLEPPPTPTRRTLRSGREF